MGLNMTRFTFLLGAPPPGVHGEEVQATTGRTEAIVRTALPPAAASAGLLFGLVAARATLGAPALRVARFANLFLASVLTGNGVGSVLFTHPALDSLPERETFAAEQALTRRYPGTMRILMPLTVASGLSVLALVRDRASAPFRLTAAGTLGFVGVLATTGLELPLNKRTLKAPTGLPPADWAEMRSRWERINRLRTLCEVAGWSCLCLGAITEAPRSAGGEGQSAA